MVNCFGRKAFLWIGLLPLLAQTGCGDFPRDPDDTLQTIRQGTLRVGYAHNPPWVVARGPEPAGLEPDLIRSFARTQRAEVEWVLDSEQDLLEKLRQKELHLVVAGLTDKNPWSKNISFSRPYQREGKHRHVIAVRKGENAFTLALENFLYAREQKLPKHQQP
jgi:polar amino acid transport system substrate-binding protein